MSRRYILPQESGKIAENPTNLDANKPLPPYFSVSMNQLPKSMTLTKLPIFVSITPSGPTNIPVVDYRNRYNVRCSLCHGYLSCHCRIMNEKVWKCGICGNCNALPYGFTLQSDEVHYEVYDILNQINPKNKLEEFKKLFVVAIDTTDDDYCKEFAGCLKKLLMKMENDIYLVIILFGNDISLYDPVKNKKYIYSDLKEMILQPMKLERLEKTREFYIRMLDKLILKNRTKNISRAKLKPVFDFAKQLMKDNGGILCVSLYGCPSDIIQRQEPTFLFPEQENDFKDESFSLNFNNISVHMFLKPSKDGRNNESVITAVPSGLTSGLFHFVTDLDVLRNELTLTLTQKYFWQSCGILRMPNCFKVVEHLGNCVIHNSGASSFGAFSYFSSISYAIQPTIKEIPQNQVCLQFAINFRNDEGLDITRVFSFVVNVSNIFNVNNSTMESVSLKKISNFILNDNNFESSKLFLNNTFNQGFRFDKIRLFNDNVSVDSKIEDIVFLRNSRPIDILLYISPRQVETELCKFCQTNNKIIIKAQSENETIIKQLLLGDANGSNFKVLDNNLNQEFWKFYEQSKSLSGKDLPVLFMFS